MCGRGIEKAVLPVFTAFILLIFSGCATVRHPVPPELVGKARINNMDEIRIIMGEHHTALQESLVASWKEERPGDFPVGPDGIKHYSALAISGGGANGAYGAGLLKGWSEEGSRPIFKVVTGVSTGAIIAPYAFLGKDYDDDLEKLYTTMSTKDVMAGKFPLFAVFGDSLASNKPLEKTIRSEVTDEILTRIVEEHKNGRRLFVGTANIDAQKFVIWDMGAIAARGDRELFCKVILASAAIPMIFPPSIFNVEASGEKYDEMHTDGGTMTQVFTTAKLLEGMKGAAAAMGIDPSKIRAKLYIIRNGYMSPRYKKVKDNLHSIAERSFDIIIDSQGVGDTYRIYTFMKERGSDFNLAFIPPDFESNNNEMFDTEDMKRLFRRGYEDASSGYKWHKAPPGAEKMSVQEK